MKAEIAVATTSGKAYYLIVNELKKRNMPFLSLTPGESIPIEIRAVVTTENERKQIYHERVLVYRDGVEPETLINEAVRVMQGKGYYDRLIIGIDPGEVFGLAVLADGRVAETGNCFSVEDTVNKIRGVLKSLESTSITSVSIKVGNGVPACKERLLQTLDKALPNDITLESVSEAGTDRYLSEAKHRRGLRDIVSTIQIAGRNGQIYTRGKTSEQNS